MAGHITDYVTGSTYNGFPVTKNAIQSSLGRASTGAFVTTLNASGSALLFSTYLGGTNSGNESGGLGIALDGSGNIYVAGGAGSSSGTYPVNFPTTSGAVQTAYGGGMDDAFVAEISAVVSVGAVPAASIASAADSRSLASITGNIDPQGIADPPTLDMLSPPAAVSSTSKSQDMTAPSSTSVPSSGSPTPTADQLFASIALILSDAGNAHQLGMFSMPALWQSIDAVAMQHLDALLSLEAGAMGISKDTLMRDHLLAS